VAVKIKLKRIGKMREPHYRIVIADARTKRGGRAIEEIGQYHPIHDPSLITLDSDRVQYWLGVGAQPTEAVAAILRVTGDWQKFKGEPAPPPMKIAEPKADKKLAYEAALKNKDSESAAEAKPARAKKTAKTKPESEAAPKPESEAESELGEILEADAAQAPADDTAKA
jgi:small subunit ribosomal protein S16